MNIDRAEADIKECIGLLFVHLNALDREMQMATPQERERLDHIANLFSAKTIGLATQVTRVCGSNPRSTVAAITEQLTLRNREKPSRNITVAIARLQDAQAWMG